MTATRRLAAILAADVAGYSRLIGVDEGGTLARLKDIRAELIDPTIASHNGRLVKTTGDGLLVEFGSVVDALRYATEVQAGMAQRNAPTPADKRIEFRIGINVGDVVVENGDIFGDGVNVAARLEALAEPGGICVSARVQEDAVGKLDLSFEDMGEQRLKNIARPVRAYRVGIGSAQATAPKAPALALPDKPSIAVLPRISSPVEPDKEECIRARKDKITASPRSDRPVHCLEFDGQGAQRHRDGSRPADLDDAIDTATIGQLTGLRVPVRRLGVVDHVRGAQSLPYPGGGSFRPPNQSQTA